MTTRPFSSLAAHGWVLLCALVTTPLAAQEAPKESAKPLSPAQLYKQCLPSVLTLKVKYADDTAGFGTGFLALKEGCALTAWHVVRNARSVTAKFADGEEFEVSGVVDRDEKRDLALVRVKVAARPLLTLSPADPEVGARAYAIGAPKGLDFSLSDGLISQIRAEEGKKAYQFSSPISAGNSGGPLLLDDGRVVGVVRSRIVEGQNLNFAVPAVYALGLDSTLPTKPWDQLVEVDAPPLTSDKIRELLHIAYIVLVDVSEVLYRAEDEVAQAEGAYREGIPDYLDRCKIDMAVALQGLGTLRAKKQKSPLIDPLEIPLQRYASALILFTDAVDEAVKQDGWTKEAMDLHSQAIAKWNEAFDAEKPLYAMFASKKVPGDMVSLLAHTMRTIYDSPTDESGWELGIRMLASEPMVVFRFKPDAWARKLYLVEGDRILSVDRKRVDSVLDIKKALEKKVGDYVFITVERDGKEETLSRKVPPINKTKK